MLNCREVTQQADRYLEGDLSRRQRFAMRLHLMLCSHCRRYVRQMRALLEAIPSIHQKATDREVEEIMAHLHAGQQPTAGHNDTAL